VRWQSGRTEEAVRGCRGGLERRIPDAGDFGQTTDGLVNLILLIADHLQRAVLLLGQVVDHTTLLDELLKCRGDF